MSRIGKQIIKLPEKVSAEITDGLIVINGPLGILKRPFNPIIEIICSDNQEITFKPRRETVESRALWGTYAAHVKNMVSGVVTGYQKKLIIEGVGYRANLSGDKLTLSLGLSHPIELIVPSGLKVLVEKNIITISGVDKELVGQFSADIRALKKPEPYKGKGIRYETEIVRRKEGKRATT